MRIDRLNPEIFKGVSESDQGLNRRFTLVAGNNGVRKSILPDALSVAFGSFLPGFPVERRDSLNAVVEPLNPAEGAQGFVLRL